jgi:hypothetical protein
MVCEQHDALLCACFSFWGIVLLGIAADVFLQVACHFWCPTGHAVDWAIAMAEELLVR